MSTSAIGPIRLPEQIGTLNPTQNVTQAAGANFQSVFSSAVNTVNSLQNNSNVAIQQFLSGEGGELHQVAMEQQKASMALDLFLQVRNKAVSAYQEIMRMQL
jgi:flagellar hook-basal body complex protein FliE